MRCVHLLLVAASEPLTPADASERAVEPRRVVGANERTRGFANPSSGPLRALEFVCRGCDVYLWNKTRGAIRVMPFERPSCNKDTQCMLPATGFGLDDSCGVRA